MFYHKVSPKFHDKTDGALRVFLLKNENWIVKMQIILTLSLGSFHSLKLKKRATSDIKQQEVVKKIILNSKMCMRRSKNQIFIGIVVFHPTKSIKWVANIT